MHEIETKVLEVDEKGIKKTLKLLGAKEIQDIGLVVDWYGPKGLTHNGDDPYFLRVRSYSTGKVEVTCKWNKKIIGNTVQCDEVNILVDSHDKTKSFFEAIGLEHYAHQEKKRISWMLGDLQFDLDTYPKMPAYLEIEAKNEEEINNAIKKLNLENNDTWNDGEKSLIEGKYELNWRDMRF